MAKLQQLVIGLGVEEKTLLSWTKNFKIHPVSNADGQLIYTEEQVQFIQLIHHLIKERGFTIIGAKKELKKGDFHYRKQQTISRLVKIRTFLEELKESI